MTLQTGRRRTAFTLIEMLVVIVIIATLVSLVGGAVQMARESARRTQNGFRMNQIAQAIEAVKAPREKGGLNLESIPSVGPNTDFPAGFRLMASYTGSEPELRYLRMAFPQWDPSNAATGFNPPATLTTSNQVLVFFLTGGQWTNYKGFSNNPRWPTDPASAGEVRKGPYVEVSPGLLDPTGMEFVDPYGTPYIYFAAAPRTGYAGQSAAGGSVQPYQTATGFVNPKGFQIISAGRDRVFGPGGPLPAVDPRADDDQGHFSRELLSSPTAGN